MDRGRTCTTSLKYPLSSTTLGRSKPRPRSQRAVKPSRSRNNISCRQPRRYTPLGEPKASYTRLQPASSVPSRRPVTRELRPASAVPPPPRAEVRLHPACGERRPRRQQQWPAGVIIITFAKIQGLVQSNIHLPELPILFNVIRTKHGMTPRQIMHFNASIPSPPSSRLSSFLVSIYTCISFPFSISKALRLENVESVVRDGNLGEHIKRPGTRHAELAHDNSARGRDERVPVAVEDRVAEEADGGFCYDGLVFFREGRRKEDIP